MPRDLFGDVASRPQSVSSRRAPLVIASIVSHVLLVILVVVTTLVAADAMPIPREALAFFDRSMPIRNVKLPPPPPRPRATPAQDPPAPALNAGVAPLVAPDGIAAEVERDLVSAERMTGIIDGNSGFAGGVGDTALEPPPPPRAPPVTPVRLHQGIRAPQKLVNVAPIYPPMAMAAKVQGIVIIEATIDVDGRVTSAKVLRKAPFLEEAALEAVRQWKFAPALLNGVPVPVIMTVTVNFTLP
jgi:protein TonB